MRELVPPENGDLEGTETPSNIIDDVSGDPEEPEKPVRQYNFLTLLRRVRKFLPYVLPFRSRAAIFLTGMIDFDHGRTGRADILRSYMHHTPAGVHGYSYSFASAVGFDRKGPNRGSSALAQVSTYIPNGA